MINILHVSAYIALMFFGPLVIAFCAIAGVVYSSKTYLWPLSAIIALLLTYIITRFDVVQSVKMWGDSAFSIACQLIAIFLVLAIFDRK
ncbi:TPA: hypothetical protein N2E68_004292 [Salmonella enterica]|nr:hypothetical protein [Salmonella enterica]HCL4864144.1 hypothetical protein [Salmonella enterica]